MKIKELRFYPNQSDSYISEIRTTIP